MSFLNVSAQNSENKVPDVKVNLEISTQKSAISEEPMMNIRVYVGSASQGCLPMVSSFINETQELKKTAYKAILERIYRQYMIYEIVHMPPKVEVIAAGLQMSASRFNNLFKHYFGCNFYTCYMQRKMEYACRLLKLGYRAKHISAEIGYSQPIKFNKAFQKYLGITPKQYQRRYLAIID